MMKPLRIITLSLLLIMLISACQNNDNATIKISLKNSRRALSDGAPGTVSFFKIYVSAPDMENIEKEVQASAESISLSLKPGNNRKITLAAFDSSRFGAYAGSATVDLSAGESREVYLQMKKTLRMAGDINPDAAGSAPSQITEFNNGIAFAATTPDHGTEVWFYDGTATPFRISDINSGPGNSSPSNFAVLDGKLYFSATDIEDVAQNYELCVYDGSGDARILYDINPAGSSNPVALTPINGRLFFVATDDRGNNNLYIYNPSEPAGTDNPKYVEINAGGNSFPYPSSTTFHQVGDRVVFVASLNSESPSLMSLDSSLNTTEIPIGINTYPNPENFTVANNILFFTAAGDESNYNTELWWSRDGVTAEMAIDIDGDEMSASLPQSLYVKDNLLFFTAADLTYGRELRFLDTTQPISASNPQITADFSSGTAGTDIFEMAALQDYLIFNYVNATYESFLELYNPADGTITTLFPLSSLSTFGINAIESSLLIAGSEPERPADLYMLKLSLLDLPEGDRTIQKMIINPAAEADVRNLSLFGNKLYFQANDGTHGGELWVYEHYE